MGKWEEIPAESGLLTEELKEQLKGVLEKLERPLLIRAALEEGGESSLEMAGFLKAFCALSDRLSCVFADAGAEKELEDALACQGHYPAAGLWREDGSYTGISFLGIPGGREINSLVLALYNVAGKGQPLEPALRERIEALPGPLFLRVFVSLSCHHCAESVAACQRMASLNEGVQAQMVDARLYPDWIQEYRLERIPVILVNKERRIVGGKTMEELTALLEET